MKSKQTKKLVTKTAAGATRTTPSPARRHPARATAPRRGEADPIALLIADHRRVKTLLNAMQAARTESRRMELIDQTIAELTTHAEIEEQVFYPAFRAAAQKARDRQQFHEATEEHRTVDMVMPEVRQATGDPDVFAARAKVLKELVEHHVKEEQEEMFPRARRILSADQLRTLGEQIAARQRAAKAPAGIVRTVGKLVGLTR